MKKINIVFIGLDGSGKTTLSLELEKELSKNHLVKIIKSSKKNVGILNSICKTFKINLPKSLEINAYYLDLLNELQRLNDQEADIIIWDRYFYCINIYFKANGVNSSEWEWLTSKLPVPDYVFYLKISPDIAVERLEKRGDRKETENIEYMSKISYLYDEFVKDKKVVILDANNNTNNLVKQIIKIIGE